MQLYRLLLADAGYHIWGPQPHILWGKQITNKECTFGILLAVARIHM